MVSSKETTPAAYLASLPPDRRAVIAKVRALIRKRLPKGYVETMNWGMLSYEIPLSRYPDTYNKQPLSYIGLAAQKNNYAIYMMNAYADSEVLKKLQDGFKAAGLKLDMGKCCIRFRKLENIPMNVIGDAVAATPVEEMIEWAETARRK